MYYQNGKSVLFSINKNVWWERLLPTFALQSPHSSQISPSPLIPTLKSYEFFQYVTEYCKIFLNFIFFNKKLLNLLKVPGRNLVNTGTKL